MPFRQEFIYINKYKITSFFHSLLEKGFAQKLILVEYNSFIVDKKIILSKQFLPPNISEIKSNLVVG